MGDTFIVPNITKIVNAVLKGTITAGPGAAFTGTFDATNATFTGLTVSGGSLTNITLITPTLINPTINGGTLTGVTINNSNFNGGTITNPTIVASSVSGAMTLLPGSSIIGGGTPPATIAYSPTGFNMTGFFNSTNADITFDPSALRGLFTETTIAVLTDLNPLLTPPAQLTIGLNFYSVDNGPFRLVIMQFGNPTTLSGFSQNANAFFFAPGKIPAQYRPILLPAVGTCSLFYTILFNPSFALSIRSSKIIIGLDGSMTLVGGWIDNPGGQIAVLQGLSYTYIADGTIPI
jgi:hypothetical protein